MNTYLTHSEVSEILNYNPGTGVFEWKAKMCANVGPGVPAGCISPRGYRKIQIHGVKYSASRLAYLLMTGCWPLDCMDHINHQKSDDRWLNLRAVSQDENMKNTSLRKNNKSGIVGVYWNPDSNKWTAGIRVNRQRTHLGHYADKIDAIFSRKNAEIKYGFHQNHGAAQ